MQRGALLAAGALIGLLALGWLACSRRVPPGVTYREWRKLTPAQRVAWLRFVADLERRPAWNTSTS